MSDVSSHEQDPTPAEPDSDERSQSVGLYLAGQRRMRGISIDELSARTRIPRRNIERLEAGAFDAAPDGFSRGFVRTVATALGLDSDEAVTRLMTEPRADDALLLSERRARMVVRVAVQGTALLVGAAGWKFVAAMATPAAPESETGVVYRRDPVRDLADGELGMRTLPSAVAPIDAMPDRLVEEVPGVVEGLDGRDPELLVPPAVQHPQPTPRRPEARAVMEAVPLSEVAELGVDAQPEAVGPAATQIARPLRPGTD